MWKNQRGDLSLSPYLLFTFIILTIYFGYMVMMSNMTRAQATIDYSYNILDGSLNAAAREVDMTAYLNGVKQIDMPRAKARFEEIYQSFRDAEAERGLRITDKLQYDIGSLVEINAGEMAPSGWRVYTDSLHIAGSYAFNLELPFLEGQRFLTYTINLSSTQGIRVVDSFSGPVF
ncbi:hypothetical protein D3C78_18250 [compost metagenome]